MSTGVQAGTALVDFEGRFDGLTNEVNRRVGGMKSIFGSAFKGLAVAAGGIFAANKAKDFFGDAIAEAREAAKVGRETKTALDLNKTAGVSADGVEKLATKLSGLAGVDDEVIQTGENLLLTFNKVKNATGNGNNIFDRATEAALDMTAVVGGDLNGAITQIGKALQDPAKGAAALSKAGSLAKDDLQKLKEMAKAGVPVLEQQKFILEALEKQYKGRASAAADPIQKLSVTWGNLKERLGGPLLTVLNVVGTWLAAKLPGAIDKTAEALKPFIAGFKQVIGVLFEGDFKGGGPFAEDSPFIVGIFDFRDKVLPILRDAAQWFQDHWKQALAVAAAALLFFVSPIAAVVAGIALLYARFQVVRDGFAAYTAFIGEKLREFQGFVNEIFPQVQEAFAHFVNAAKAIWSVWGDDLIKIATGFFEIIYARIQTALELIGGVIRLVLAVINGDWGKAWDALKGIFETLWEGMLGTLRGGIKIIEGIFGGLGDTIGRTWNQLWQGMADFVDGIWVGIQNRIRSALNVVIGAVNLLIAGYNKVNFFGTDIDPIDRIPEVYRADEVNKRIRDSAGKASHHVGGVYKAPTPGGEGLALLRDGERVTTPEQDAWHDSNSRGFGEAVVMVDGEVFGRLVSRHLQRRQEAYA